MNAVTKTEWSPYLAVGIAEGFEQAESMHQYIEAWAYLIETGRAWSLQGWFGRRASDLIDRGVIDQSGQVDWELAETLF